MSLDDLRRRLDSPLFAREPGLAAAPVPNLRELTWEHVINPTSSQPVVPAGGLDDGVSRPSPIRVEDLLARPEPALAPLPERADAPASVVQVPVLDAPVLDAPILEASVLDAAVAPVAPTTGSLPSFAAMMSGEVVTTPWSGEHLTTDDLVKPIEEPPPVARETDPQVNDLAALIMRSTPSAGMPRIGEPEQFGGSVLEDVPVLDPAVELAAPQAPVHSMMSPPLVRDTGMTPVVPGSPVEAELNRLAYVPDLDDDPVGPVEVPEIAYSDVRGAPPASAAPLPAGTGPTLSQADMFTPRQAVTIHRHAYSDLVAQATPVVRKRKRHVVRKFVTTVVLLGMVAGGLFAVKHYVLDRVNWPKDVAPLATAVEGERGLHFVKDLPVTSLAAPDYAAKFVEAIAGVTADATPRTQATWRALGVLSGTLDQKTIGLAAAVDSPAFYDPASKQIYVIDGVKPELRVFALHRALTMALLDQQFKWSSQLTQAAPAVVIGTRALFDADATAVALKLLGDQDRAAIIAEQTDLATSNGVTSNPAPFASATMGRVGVALWPYLDTLDNAKRNELEQNGVLTDNHALDLRRLTGGGTDTVGSTTQGMLFWYHALASRMDDNLAWNAALGWRGDEVMVDTTGPTMCVNAKVVIDAPVAQTALFAFTAWSAGAPKESATTMTMSTDATGVGTVVVHACDPGAAVQTNDGTPSLALGGAPLRVEQFVQMLASHRSLSAAQAACAVYSNDPVTIADERSLIDPTTGWLAPSQHSAPDPAAPACAAAAPASGAPANQAAPSTTTPSATKKP